MKAAAAIGLCLLLGANLSAQTPEAVPKVTSLPGVTPPTLVSDVKPSYTAEAMRERIEGSVMLECVVNVDGTVGDVRVVTPLHDGLDVSAVEALKTWRFKPATKDGTPTAVRVDVEMSFVLGERGPNLDSPEVFKPGVEGVLEPRVLSEVKPAFPPEVMSRGVQGSVELEAVVLTDGRVGRARVVRPLDPTLDRLALQALRRWRFQPGTKEDKAVPVQVRVEMTFAAR